MTVMGTVSERVSRPLDVYSVTLDKISWEFIQNITYLAKISNRTEKVIRLAFWSQNVGYITWLSSASTVSSAEWLENYCIQIYMCGTVF